MSAETMSVASDADDAERHVRILGVDVTDMSFDAAIARLSRALDTNERLSLAFVNTHTLNLTARDAAFRETLNRAGLVFGDGTGVRWAAKTRGVSLRANLNGTDLIPALLERRPGTKVYLLGNTPERNPLAAAGFRARFPGAVLVGAHHGYLHEQSSLRVVNEINASGAELLLVGMGNPLQERWIAAHRTRLNVGVAAAVGGLTEYWAGALDRAPTWMRKAGIEWVHILRRQPKKAGRYLLGNPAFVARFLAWLPSDLKRTP